MTKNISVKEWNDNFKKWNGFDELGHGYVFLGNTFEFKDEIKAAGAKWNPNIRAWVIDHKIPDYDFLMIYIDDVYTPNSEGKYDKYFENESGVDKIVKEIREEEDSRNRLKAKCQGLHYIGDVGKKIVIDCVLTSVKEFYSNYSYYGETTYKYFFKDEEGNIIVWSTAKELDDEIELNEPITLFGTVKDHKEYRGTPQTLMTRCKIRQI